MMEYFITYDIASGEERWRGSGEQGVAALQRLPAGWGIIEVSANVYNDGDTPLADLDQTMVAAALWERVKIRRDAVINGGAPSPSGAVDSDELSRSNIAGAVLAAVIAQSASQPYSMDWTMLDNSVVTLDAAAMIAVGLAVMGHVNACHDKARLLRAEIEGAADTAALFRIDYLSGWPA